MDHDHDIEGESVGVGGDFIGGTVVVLFGYMMRNDDNHYFLLATSSM